MILEENGFYINTSQTQLYNNFEASLISQALKMIFICIWNIYNISILYY